MIAVRRDNDAGRLLALLVARPGKLDAEALGQLLWRPKVGPKNVLEVRRAILAKSPPPPSPWARVPPGVPPTTFPPREGATWAATASTLLNRLAQRGLVERCRPPQLSDDWDLELAVLVEKLEDEEQDAESAEEERSEDPGEADEDGVEISIVRDLVARLRVQFPPTSSEQWVGSAPFGNVQRAARRLVEAGIVIPPSYRWPTVAGVALVESWREASQASGERMAS